VTRPHKTVFIYLSWLAPLLFSSLAFSQNGTLHVTEPTPSRDGTIMTSEPAVSLKGTLDGTGGDRRVLWESNRGFSDLAAVTLGDDGKTVLWSSGVVPLRLGINHVRIKALGQPGAGTSVNIYYTPRLPAPAPALGTAIFHGKQITYEVRDGLAIYQSDMILGNAADVAAAASAGPRGAKSTKGLRPDALTITPGISSTINLWPLVSGVGRVPYTITNVSTDAIYPLINDAIMESNTQLTGVIQWVAATSSDLSSGNYVDFDFDTSNTNGVCEAVVGMQDNGVPQPIGGSGACTETTILHEMGHALGLYHEQSRADRNTYVNYLEQNIDKPNHANFDIIPDSVGSGLYNYASIMEYGPFTFNKDGVSPTLETIPPGIVLGTTTPQYTSGDLDGIKRLYGHTPAAITVDTNPTGLQVIVDSTACTAPCVFSSWASGSSHTLSIPTASQTLQTLSGENYIFGRWNAGLANVQTVTVTNALGDGTPLRPTTAPSITNYLASFIPVHPYSPAISPSGDATITASPLPSSSLLVNGAPTYLDRQLIKLTVNPNSGGFNFYDWYPSPFINIYTNPATVYLTDDLDSATTQVNLVTDAVTTILSTSPDLAASGLAPSSFPGFAISVTDGNGKNTTAYTPANFDVTHNGSGFASGEMLTFTAASESPVTTNISYTFSDWTGAGTPDGSSLSVTAPASGISTSTANFTPSFRSLIAPAIGTATTCPGSPDGNLLTVTSSPTGTTQGDNETYGNIDSFFNDGTVTFTASTTTSGLSFVGWSLDLAAGGTTNPYPYSLTGQVLGTANFNISGITAPLSVTSISTPSATSGTATLTINGTGFSTVASDSGPSLFTYFGPDGSYRTSTPISSTQLTMSLNAGDIPAAGYYQLTVLNNEGTTGCNPSATAVFVVTNSTGPAVLAITKSHTGNFSQGQQNAQYTIVVTNNGSGPTVDPVTVTDTVPSGETLVSMTGSGWTCSGNTCTESSALGAGLSYGAITVTVNVAANATSPQVNTASVFTATGGGAASATASDSTIISSQVSVPNVVGDTQAAATTAITGAGLKVGTVTNQTSGSVTAGDVISESPVAGTMVASGSAVNLVVSTGPGGTPSVVSVTPNPATGLSNTFALVYSDTAGNASLKYVKVLFNEGTAASNTCYASYAVATNLLSLYNNAGTGVTSITPGSGTLSNSQCTISGSGTSVVKSGNNLTLNLEVTASSTYTGVDSVFMEAIDNNSATTGWVNKGTWTPAANQPPTVVSVTPNPATGLSNTFALTYSDPNGAEDLKYVKVIFNPGTGASTTCYVSYTVGSNLLSLYNDAGTGVTSITPGSGTLSNSQCTITGSGTSVVRSGDNLTLNLPVTASSTYTGIQTVFMDAVDNSAATTGWVNKGTWTPAANQPPAVVSETPNPATGLSNTFVLTYSDPNGATNLKYVEVNFNSTTAVSNTCYASYSLVTNQLSLYNNAGTGFSSINPGSGTLSNSQCTITGSGTSVVKSGDTLTLNLKVTASSTYTGVHSVFMEAIDNSSATTGWISEGTWTPATNQSPTVVSVTPTPPVTGLTNTFGLTYSDPNGAGDLKYVKVIFGVGTGASSTCYASYSVATNLLSLYNNPGTGVTSITPGSGTLSNGQCTINGSGTSVVRSGDNLTLSLAVTASGTYTATVNIFMEAIDNSAATTGWVNEGTWTP